MRKIILTADKVKVNFAPSTEEEEILQNLQTILSTIKYTVPLDRTFGIDADFVDAPSAEARAKAENEYFKAIRLNEPRATVERITWEADADGKLAARVEVSL